MQLLNIRYYQARRDLGYWVLIFAAIGVCLPIYVTGRHLQHNLVLGGCVVYAMLAFHAKRRDLNFVSKYFDTPETNLLLNYNLTVLPLSLGFCFAGNWPFALFLQGAVSLQCLLKPKTSQPWKFTFIVKHIPHAQFEWIAGIRSNFGLLLVLLIVTLFLSPVKLFAVVALFLFNTVLLGFYGYYEPRVLLNPGQFPVKEFLSAKTRFFTAVLVCFNVPVLLINTAFQTDMLWFNLFFLIGFIVMGVTSVYMKYADYTPNGTQAFNFDYLVLFISVIVPFLLPLAIYLAYSNYKKANINLLNYTDDNR